MVVLLPVKADVRVDERRAIVLVYFPCSHLVQDVLAGTILEVPATQFSQA
jgi:hypothetical protein